MKDDGKVYPPIRSLKDLDTFNEQLDTEKYAQMFENYLQPHVGKGALHMLCQVIDKYII